MRGGFGSSSVRMMWRQLNFYITKSTCPYDMQSQDETSHNCTYHTYY